MFQRMVQCCNDQRINRELFKFITIFMKLSKLIPAIVFAVFLGSMVSAQATAMQTYFTACSYSATTGGAISGSARIDSSLNCSDSVWDNHGSHATSWTVTLSGNGSHPITSSDVDKMLVSLTWPAGDYADKGFSFNCTNAALNYDKTGSLSVGSDCSASSGCGSASVTIYNMGSVMNTVFVSGGNNYTSQTMTKGDGTQTITFRLIRGDTVNTRTVNFNVSGTAVGGTDYTVSPSWSAGNNSVTMNAGTSSLDYTIAVSGASSLVGTKSLVLTLQSGYYQMGLSSATLYIMQDVPTINLVATGAAASQNGVYAGGFALTRTGGLTNAVTASLTIGGTAIAGTDYVPIPTTITFAPNQTTTNLNVSVINAGLSAAQTVVLSLNNSSTYFQGASSNATVTLLPNSSTTNSVSSPTHMYWRGSGSDPTYWSQVIPLEFESGVVYSNLNGNCSTLYTGLSSWTSQALYHYNVTNPLPQSTIANRIAFNNPIVAFGERVGGTPLYNSQPYSFGIYAGDCILSNQPIVVQAYYRTNYQLAGAVTVYPPKQSNTNLWQLYSTNGFQLLTNAYGLTTVLSGMANLYWGENSRGAFVLTHTADSQSTNYYYLVGVAGNPAGIASAMVVDGNQTVTNSLLYSLEFSQRPAWRSAFLDQPHFNGSPLPPFYAGKSLSEMLTNTPAVTNAVGFAPSAATNLDNSPELRQHPILDNFVATMGNDPIALANYVINQIDLTDPLDVNDNGNVAEQSINPPGVTRGALGVFLEKQGSPAEQCALLVYLLRKSGVPAVYEFPPRNGMQILDTRLSQMLKFQVHGDFNQAGQLYTTNAMIPVNYPWVAAYVGTNWVHIFPWLKDYRIDEGLNLFDQMPTNYSNAYEWVHDYIYGNTNLMSLAVDGDNTMRVIFPRYLQQTLLQNHPGVSVDDIGVKIINRQHYYSQWRDFPTPTWVTNVSLAVENLSSSSLTNISPALTNIFDTMSVEIYSQSDPTKDIKTGEMRLVDLHNREFYVNQSMTGGNVQLNLILLPFRTNITSQYSFTNEASLLSKQQLSLTFNSADYQLGVRFKYHRHRAITASYAIDPTLVFLGLIGRNEMDFERPLRVGDQAAICLNYGRITRDMLNVHAANIWQMQNLLNANPSLASGVSPDIYKGALMYLAGMSYYEKSSEFSQMDQQWQKFNQLSLFAAGLSKIIPAYNSNGNLSNGTDPILPCVDMFYYQTLLAGNGTLHPDSGQNYTLSEWNFNLFEIVDGSAEEHQVINRFYQMTNAVSTVRLLQLAQSRGMGIVALNAYNYINQGATNYQGKPLQSWDASMWQEVVNNMQSSSAYGYVNAFMTPGPVTNSVYKGMGALVLNPYGYLALISPNSMNGGFAGQNLPANTVAAANTVNYVLSDNNNNYSILLNQPASKTTVVPDEVAALEVSSTSSKVGSSQYVSTPFTLLSAADTSALLNFTSGTSDSAVATDMSVASQVGVLKPTDSAQMWAKVSDPVNNMTGEFYEDETDLQLPGPLPLILRRNYSSQNLADNQFGRGWKLNIMPFLSISSGQTNIYAADPDGTVLKYVRANGISIVQSATPIWPTGSNYNRGDVLTVAGGVGIPAQIRVDDVQASFQKYYWISGSVAACTVVTGGQYTITPPTSGPTYNKPIGGHGTNQSFGLTFSYIPTNNWYPTLDANPQLENNTVAGAGGLANRLRNYIQSTVNGSTTNYTLYGADGSVRVFQFMKFDSGAIVNERPYLLKWTDSRGNYYTFTYVTNAADANFGQMQRIQCSNGNFLGFDYDIYGHIIDAYTGDGRWIYYYYDQYGDLISVTLPDGSTRSYVYQHANQAVTGGTNIYSTHLIIEADKPDGRVLQNIYDDKRRVTNQWSTAGLDLTPVRTATFVYSNNFVSTNSFTNLLTGYTLVVDGYNHTNRYDYTSNLIAKITDPLGQTIIQTWYPDSTNAPGYPRSLYQIVDKRGLTNQFRYDVNGNVTNTITFGDLTGDGISSQSATNTALYNTNNLPIQMVDAAGNGAQIVYDPVFNFLPQQTIRYAGTVPVSTNYTLYGNATNIVINGSVTQTNMAFGLPVRQIRAYGSVDAATNDAAYDGHGYIVQKVGYTGTTDPNVTNLFYYNERGQVVNQIDVLGAVKFYEYDALNRPIAQETFDEKSNDLSWSFNYYNDNGELSWVDGPRYNPEDYVYYDYDGDGRRTTEIHWRSEAKSDGSGVQTPAGYNVYAQSFYQYDLLGNLTRGVDPRGAIVTNTWDALSRLAQQVHLDTNGVTTLSVESFGYEPGGKVKFHTNALGGVTATLYTTTGQTEYQSSPDGSTNGWRYYLDGRVKREIQGNGAYWQTTYDDVNRITTRVYYTATGIPLATNSVQVDRRGNKIQQVDAGNNVFTTVYDDLDRVKVSTGPAAAGNSAQQITANYYDLAGRAVTNVNALGEMTVTLSDALGRATSNLVYSASGSLVREKYFAYSADHNSVTVTSGSGANAIASTSWTDPDGHTVLSVAYPAANATEFTLNQFDLAGNLVLTRHESSVNGKPVIWTSGSSIYDGLNRLTQKVDRDGATTTYAYDFMSDVTNRTMPGGLQWQASYNNAGQMLAERCVGTDGTGTRSNTYAYFTGGNPNAGLLQTRTDGRGVVCTYTYDDWRRATNMAYAGSLLEQNMATTYLYDPRGLLTNVTESFSTTTTGPTTTNLHTFDAYGQLANESVNAGSFSYSASQGWDAVGRRSQLALGGVNYGYGWQADGTLSYASSPYGNGSYTYSTAGLLASRTVGSRSTSITSRDGEGRTLAMSTSVNSVSQLAEAFTWSGDGLLSAHTLVRGDFTDSRSYAYANQSRRLTQEQLNLNAATTWTNTFAYDNGQASGPGTLTAVGSGTNSWNGIRDVFTRVYSQTNSAVTYAAYGRVNGQSTVSAWLDGQPVPVTRTGTNALQWRAVLELMTGTHQLKLAALHPSGQYTAQATNTFTNNIAFQTATDTYDGAGNITQRVWLNAGGTVSRTQSLAWDARGRLHSVVERDASNSGYNWTAVYDGSNHRLSTITVLVSNGVANVVSPATINSYYDPQVEFLELGVAYGATTEWKLYGPDLGGVYGGMNGIGGLDGVSPSANQFYPTISDARGNVLGVVTNGGVSWNPARPTGYGAISGYRPMALGSGAGISLASAWRGRWADVTGYYQLGLRPYDPVSGRWLTYDSVWNAADPNYYSFAGGDPVNGFDSDGRCVDGSVTAVGNLLMGAATFAANTLGAASYAVASPFAPNWAYQEYGGYAQGFANNVTGTAQTTYNLAATATYGAISPFAPEAAYNNYGGNVQQLMGQAPAFYGGNDQSLAYKIGYGTVNAAAMLFGGEVGEAGNLGRVGEVSSTADAIAVGTTEAWKNLPGGMQIQKVGDTWIKQVNPDASALAQWWGRGSLDAQAKALGKLGDMAPEFSYDNRQLIMKDAGTYTPGNFWNTWAEGTMRLWTPMNDIRPRNIGANGIIFDPALHPIQQGVYWIGAGAVGAGAGYGIYSLFNNN
jgi:RHS repeat-associated protein